MAILKYHGHAQMFGVLLRPNSQPKTAPDTQGRNAQQLELMSVDQGDDDLGAPGFKASRSMERSLSHAPPAECGSCLPGRKRDAKRAFEGFVRNNCGPPRVALACWFFLIICGLLLRMRHAPLPCLMPPDAAMNAERKGSRPRLTAPRIALVGSKVQGRIHRPAAFGKTVSNPHAGWSFRRVPAKRRVSLRLTLRGNPQNKSTARVPCDVSTRAQGFERSSPIDPLRRANF